MPTRAEAIADQDDGDDHPGMQGIDQKRETIDGHVDVAQQVAEPDPPGDAEHQAREG